MVKSSEMCVICVRLTLNKLPYVYKLNKSDVLKSFSVLRRDNVVRCFGITGRGRETKARNNLLFMQSTYITSYVPVTKNQNKGLDLAKKLPTLFFFGLCETNGPTGHLQDDFIGL